MILQEIKSLRTGRRELRNFGLLVGAVFAVLGILFLARGKSHYPYFLLPGAVLMATGVIFPRGLKEVYVGWMSLAILLGFIVSNVILVLFFCLVITPIGLIARIAGKDFLKLRLERDQATYWIPRPKSPAKAPADYERQF